MRVATTALVCPSFNFCPLYVMFRQASYILLLLLIIHHHHLGYVSSEGHCITPVPRHRTSLFHRSFCCQFELGPAICYEVNRVGISSARQHHDSQGSVAGISYGTLLVALCQWQVMSKSTESTSE